MCHPNKNKIGLEIVRFLKVHIPVCRSAHSGSHHTSGLKAASTPFPMPVSVGCSIRLPVFLGMPGAGSRKWRECYCSQARRPSGNWLAAVRTGLWTRWPFCLHQWGFSVLKWYTEIFHPICGKQNGSGCRVGEGVCQIFSKVRMNYRLKEKNLRKIPSFS